MDRIDNVRVVGVKAGVCSSFYDDSGMRVNCSVDSLAVDLNVQSVVRTPRTVVSVAILTLCRTDTDMLLTFKIFIELSVFSSLFL